MLAQGVPRLTFLFLGINLLVLRLLLQISRHAQRKSVLSRLFQRQDPLHFVFSVNETDARAFSAFLPCLHA